MKVTHGMVMALLLTLAAGALSAQPPYSGYSPTPSHSYLSGYGFHIQSYELKIGASPIQQKLNSGGTASPCYADYTGTVTPANMVPASVHTVTVTFGTGTYTYNMGASVWIDYNNDGDFNDANERVCYTATTVAQPGPVNMTFTPPTGIGGLRRLRVRVTYSSTPTNPSSALTYGETEDYLVNLGFAIATTSPLPTGAQGTFYSTDIVAVNGATPYTWQGSPSYLISGSLPAGLSAAPVGNDLRISGTPTTPGTSTFTVSVTDNAAKNSQKQFQITIFPPPAAMPFTDDFSTDKGWQLAGQWSRGVAMAYTGTGPNRSEPGTDHSASSDNMILGHNRGGDYPNSMSSTEWATSPPINCAAATTVRLRYWRWIGVSPSDVAKIQITNNGVSWTDVWTAPSGSTTNDSAWTSCHHDISSVAAGNAVVQIRFGMGPTDSSIVNVGWCLDDLLIEQPAADMLVQETGATGPVITDGQAVGGGRNFGQIAVSTQSPPLTIYITNNGPTNIIFGTFNKVGSNPTDFYINGSALTNPLPPGQSTSFTVVFYRTTAGVSTATIEIPHNAAYSGTSPFEINLQGEAIVPQPIIRVNETTAGGTLVTHNLSPAGTIRDFGNQDINAGPSAQITIFITNSGTGTLAISTPDMGGAWWTEYQIDSTGMQSQLTAGQSTSFKVAFDPGSQGQKDAVVRIAHTDGTQASPFYVPVTGNGTSSAGPVLRVHEGTVSGPQIAHADPATGGRDFGNQLVAAGATPPVTITIENGGGVAMTLGTPILSGTNPGEFVLTTTGFTNSVAAGASTSFQVAFDPTSVGTKLAQVTFTHDDTTVTSPFIVNVRGNGVTTAPDMDVRETDATGTLLANPAPATGILNFGTQDVNAGPTAAAVIYVENNGTANLTLGVPSFQTTTTEFQLMVSGFSGTIAPGGNATFSITFDPTTTGTHTAVVQFTHNDGAVGTPFILNLTGNAVRNAPLLEVREGTTIGAVINSGDSAIGSTVRDLGSVDVNGGNTFPGIIVIINNGTLNLNLGTPVLSGVNSADFSLNLASFNATVTPGNSTQIDVLFDPVLAGMKDCQVEFTHNDPGAPSPFIVRFLGTGTDPNAVLITTPELPAGMPDSQYGPLAMTASQGTTPYVWSVYSGNLPPGLTMSPGGVISGTPTGFGGNYQVIIRVADQTGATNEKTYTVVVTSANGSRKAEAGCAAGTSGSHTGLVLLTLLGILALSVRSVRRRA